MEGTGSDDRSNEKDDAPSADKYAAEVSNEAAVVQSGSELGCDGALSNFHEAVKQGGFDQQLTDLILSEPDRKKRPEDQIPLEKCDWFNTDDPMDSEDELFAREYCSQRVPDMGAIYEKMDPHGVRKYAHHSVSTMERTLGRVYQVNQPLFDEEAVNESHNTYELPSHLQEDSDTTDKTPINEDETTHRVSDNIRDTSGDDISPDGSEPSDSDEYELSIEDSDVDTNDSVIEDDAFRYFVKLPMLSWTTSDRDALETARAKLSSYNRHYKEKPREPGISSPYSVFTSEPCSGVGVSDGSCDMSLSEELAALGTVKMDPIELHIEEYTHSDLLNDIDAYEAAEYPPEVAEICTSDADLPIFTMADFVPRYSDVNVVDPQIYVSVPKSSIKESETGMTVVNEGFLVKRVRDKRLGHQVSDIPLVSEPQIGTILIPNEFGYMDQNIRYLADEIGVISRSLVFVPDISDNDLVFSLTLNRLIKLIQTTFNVDRIALVALGSQGRRVIHYTYTAMLETVQRTLNDFKEVDPKFERDKYRSLSNFGRLHNIVRRQSTTMLDDIVRGIQAIEHNESIKAAERSRDYNVVKPLSNILQSIVLWDSVGVNFKEVAELGVPVLFNMSNRVNLFDGLLRLDNPKFLVQKERCLKNDSRVPINMFDFLDGELPRDLSDVITEHVRLRYINRGDSAADELDTYHMSTNHTGIDVYINVFKQASGHFYMKKPDAPTCELTSMGNAILSCADWISSWCF
ncbi:uncharacterized protein BXIN_0683 [Babesia sp. Xinjiang]|uniref:uncharacterized protein n=1 Tax=Babesia sp. Xinjiang TaxID=462227 RepID=UPI000A25B8E4|nr:uncharacterized protein BXIN_0716 [Babesia sp. Xinjiang]XP_028872604.1 uncharacterized protein BXIN_0683 [Babesia sp. Xinjiang]ORM42111.1 hypothetical protein BXIN_0716 [Babesia sp. Xinjiang]ORM42148.1 hypothetical protein BXIN_0683 [Babesia sp. Xinjiang]